LALTSVGWWLSVSLKDNAGDETTQTYQLVSADAAAAATDTADIIAALNGVTDAVIFSYQFYERFVEDAFAYPASGVELQNMALLDFDIVDHPEKTATRTVPAASPGIFNTSSGAGANIIDTADAAVVAYRDVFRTGGNAYISDGEVAESLVKGRRIHRKSRIG
jgi:hypothetical protein